MSRNLSYAPRMYSLFKNEGIFDAPKEQSICFTQICTKTGQVQL